MNHKESTGNLKKDFLLKEFFLLSWSATVQHSKTYCDDVRADQKDELITRIRSYLCRHVVKYATGKKINHSLHAKRIHQFKDKVNQYGKEILLENGFTFGKAQKLLNLFLKYLWCAGFVEKPVHLPIDSIILNKVGIRNLSWTRINDKDCYLKIIDKIREKAKENDLAMWELRVYGRRKDDRKNEQKK